jgi:hypothetical protein
MRKISIALFAAAVATTAVTAYPVAAAPGDIMLSANLAGGSETPPNDVGATGMFMARVNPASGQLCYTLTSQSLPALTMAHIHVGAMGVAGPPVVVLAPDVPKETCMAIDAALAAKLVATPGDYYVNIHTSTYPKGAIRGQLTK